ncbi:MAG TPA: ORF6N domain-containing protein [Solirubrobacterales bacterium]
MARKETVETKQVGVPPAAAVQARILVIRERQVMLDQDLAELYGVETKTLTRAVRRNEDRFPADFMFRLTAEEFADLRSQFGTSSYGHGGRRYPPFAFTEQGVAMLSSVLRGKRAVVVNIEIMRAFVEIRHVAANYKELEKRISDLEKTAAGKFGEHEEHLATLFKALKQLAAPPPPKPKHPIGFSPPDTKEK